MKRTFIWQWLFICLLVLLPTACSGEATEEFAVTLVVPTAVNSGDGETVATQPTATSEPINAAPTVTIPGDGSGDAGTGTETAVPTPTLQPTNTPISTPVATPETNPATQTVNGLPLPGISREMLFIADGALKLWRQNGQVDTLLPGAGAGEREYRETTLTGDVSSFAVSEDGRFLVAARVTYTDPISKTLPQTFEILAINRDSRETRALVTGAFDVHGLTLSRDGQYVAFVAQTTLSKPDEAEYEVRVLQTGNGGVKLNAPCAVPCGNLVWHPDNQNVAWGNGAVGVQLYNVTAKEPQLLLANQPGAAIYGPIAWARNGRFLLMWRSPIEGGDRVVFDVPTGQVMPVPNSFVYVDPHWVDVTWMQDDRLLVSRPQVNEDQLQPPVLEIWRVNPDQGQLVREETDTLPVAPSGIAAPFHLLNGRFAFLLYNPTSRDVNGVYILKGFGDQLDRVNALWPATTGWELNAAWNPDGSGVVIQQGSSGVFYAPSDNSTLYNIQAALGQWARDFYWLPPRPQS